jgi:hypothetical protein
MAQGTTVSGKRVSEFHELSIEWVEDVTMVAKAWHEFDNVVFVIQPSQLATTNECPQVAKVLTGNR